MPSCQSQLTYYNESLALEKPWAKDLYSLHSRLSTYILHGDIGHYTECLKFRHKPVDDDIGIIQGQFCAIRENGSDTTTYVKRIFESGYCIPDTCNADDLRSLGESIFNKPDLKWMKIYCQRNEGLPLGVLDYCLIVFFVLLIVTIICSTTYDVLMRKRPHAPIRSLTAFSLYTNIRNLFHIVYQRSPNVIECMDGLRVLSAFWVVASHRLRISKYSMVNSRITTNFIGTFFVETFFEHVGYAVDIFFLLSAILVTQLYLRALERKKLNLLKFYLNRYLRYVPSMMFIIIFIISSLSMQFVDGPLIAYFQEESKRCNTYWWSALLLIQTYANPPNVCLVSTWYLNTDFQLYLISPIFIYAAWKLGYKSFWIFGSILAVDQIIIFSVIFTQSVSMRDVYRQTHYRLGQWLVGISIGYFMYRQSKDETKIEIPEKLQYCIWAGTLASFIIQTICIYLIKETFYYAFYAATHRILFTCLIGWLIYSFHCLRGGNCFRWFLSHPLWQPISKLSLSIYLTHMLYHILSVSNTKRLGYFEIGWFMHIVAGDFVMCIIYGMCLYLFVEAPVAVFLNYYFR